MEGAGYRVVFEKGGVYLHTSAKKHQDPDSLIAGVVRVVEKDNDVLLHWAPVEEAGDSTQILFSKKDASGGDSCTSEDEPTFDPGYEPDWAVISTVQPRPRRSEPTRGAEPSCPRDSWAFWVSLGELKSIRRSKPGLSWAYLVLVTQAGGSLPALHFHRGGTRALLRVLSRYLLLASSPQDSRLYLVFPHDSSALSNSFHHLQLFDQDSSNVVSRFLQDPYSTTFNSFSRVTNFFRGALQPHPEGASRDLHPVPDDEPEPGFEVISCVELGPRPAVEGAPPATEEEWARHVGPEGRLQQVPEPRARIFSGGLSPSLRREAWKFLLGYLSWDGSAEEHKAHVRKKTDEYFRMKLQWKSVSPEQERRNSLLHGYRSLIGIEPATWACALTGTRTIKFLVPRMTSNQVLWTGLPGPNLHLLVACAILDMERDTLMLSGFGSNEILKHINELTMKLSVEDVLTRAEALYRQLTACTILPEEEEDGVGA
ncbi:TBC1 domain family member 17 [Myotis davidii]|uniref:TBC1 domain family member 17 n=1 Tax=Myotis davidii TaxID=225400 RepID=L5LR56_MYODS|nr:TBC1 domain family member 17 [Myotis davidii]